jgi:NAD(P)-dependent dehydrogenase (short-subunit alcohol dehydrogenase family)
MKIHESVIIITAASTPIGRAMALHFAQLGASLALIDRDKQALNTIHQACLSIQPNCAAFVLNDEKKENGVIDIFNQIIHSFHRIDVLINTASAEPFPPLFGKGSTDQFCHSLNKIGLNFFAFVKQAAEQMRAQEHAGVILNLVLDREKNTQDSSLNPAMYYDGTKALISGLTHSWAEELAEFNIRVGGIVPLDIPIGASGRDKQQRQYDWVRNAEYIVCNDSFNGRLLESAL